MPPVILSILEDFLQLPAVLSRLSLGIFHFTVLGEMSIPKVGLRDGRSIPVLGLGTYECGGEPTSWALEKGCRLIDTATLYK